MMYLAVTSLVKGQVEDTVILHPVQPACPGQDVTINCTIVRVTTLSGVEPPPLQWQYRGDSIGYNNPSAIAVTILYCCISSCGFNSDVNCNYY